MLLCLLDNLAPRHAPTSLPNSRCLCVQHIFIDSLMKCVKNEDDFNGQKGFIDELTALARDHNVHIHLVHHIRKQASDEVTPNKNDLKGSGSISDQVDNVFLATIQDSAVGADVILAQFLWEIINDSQTANWTEINNSQSTTWQVVKTQS